MSSVAPRGEASGGRDEVRSSGFAWACDPALSAVTSCSACGHLDGLLLCEACRGVMDEESFEVFVARVEPRLRRGLLGAVGVDRVEDAVAEALAYAFEHWAEVSEMTNAAGYLFRVGQSRSRRRRRPHLFRRVPDVLPDVEPGLVEALCALPESQRTAVWLAHGCSWSHAEIAEVLGVSTSTVATHVSRALGRLRTELGVVHDAQS
jgi:DNA-directed RNA polymerase specialized sigma24 family protein